MKDLATRMHEAMLDLGGTADEVAASLSMANVRGWRNDADGDANPVCLYLNSVVGHRCRKHGKSVLALGAGGRFIASVAIGKPA